MTEAAALGINLKVIGAGMGRTGTTSLKAALEMLLEGPCFHYHEYKSRPELMAPWSSLVESMPLASDPKDFPSVPISRWQMVMPDYVACVDEPASYYWKQLSEVFPKALVILSIREPGAWWASMQGLYQHRQEELKRPERISPERRAFLDFENAIYPFDQDTEPEEETEVAFFEAHNRRVIEYAEHDESFRQRLLVWRVEDGWEPICKALGLPAPSIPFPHKNKLADYHGY